MKLNCKESFQSKVRLQTDDRSMTIDRNQMCDIDDFDCTSLCIEAMIEHLKISRAIQSNFVVEIWFQMKLDE